ncbi:Mu transposase C-terminal domain-containing protein, partial [Roseospira navarrensis]
RLDVIAVKGRGGRGGVCYQVRARSIPGGGGDQVTPPEPLPAPAPAATAGEVIPKDLRAPAPATLPAWKVRAIQRVRQAGEPGSPERARALEAVAADTLHPDGKRRGKRVAPGTLRKWVQTYEAGGATALARKDRADRGRRRVVISRAWDDAARTAGLSEEALEGIKKALETAIGRQFRAGHNWQVVQLNVTPVLVEASRAAGMDLPDATLIPLCRVPRNLIEPHRHSNRAAHMYRRDAGKSAAVQVPRIRRDRSHLRPMDFVAGDVHHLDVLVRRPDGSLATPKAIAWQDLATNRLFATLVLKPRGEAVKRRDVLGSFAAMCADPRWGVPGRLYLDNGSEYALFDALADDMLALQRWFAPAMQVLDAKDLAAGVRKSRPYNPQSKVIETAFAILERTVLSQVPGHIGGDRMKKKTQNQGKDPVPYDGDFTALEAEFADFLAYYHNKPQSGHLAGKSPNDSLRAFITDGWQSVTLDPHQLEIAFSKVETRSVYPGGAFTIGGTEYRSDRLITLAGSGRKVTVRVPLIGDGGRMYVFDEEDAFLDIATEPTRYVFGDPAGAKDQARQAGILRREVAAQGQVPADTRDSMRAVNALFPAPQPTSAGQMSINPEFQDAARRARALPDASVRVEEDRAAEGISSALARLAARANRKAANG